MAAIWLVSSPCDTEHVALHRQLLVLPGYVGASHRQANSGPYLKIDTRAPFPSLVQHGKRSATACRHSSGMAIGMDAAIATALGPM
jgi:hypothetical protein